MTRKGALPRLLAQTKDREIVGLVEQLLAALGRCRPLTLDFGAHLAAFVTSGQLHLDPKYGAAYRLRGDPRKVETLRWAKVDAACTQLFAIHLSDVRRTLERLIAVVENTPSLPFADNTIADLRAILDGIADQLQLQHDIVGAAQHRDGLLD